MHVLLIDDDARFTAMVARFMRRSDVELTIARTGRDGLRKALETSFDAVLLDLTMPEWSGFETLARFQEAGIRTPVLFLSGSDSTENVVRGLDGGGVDFIEKPFEPRELLARLRAAVRRSGSSADLDGRRIAVGALEIDTLAHRASWDGTPLPLTRTELRLLQALAIAAGEIVTREDLRSLAWGSQDAVGDEALGVHISNLRRRLAAAGAPNLVETVRFRGYRFVPPTD